MIFLCIIIKSRINLTIQTSSTSHGGIVEVVELAVVVVFAGGNVVVLHLY